MSVFVFFFQAEDGIRDVAVTGVQTCALPISAAKRLGVERAYDDYRMMLDREKPLFVVVAPRWLDGHKDMILACAENGALGVFCEKPLAPDLTSCDAIVAACERSHVKLAMA